MDLIIWIVLTVCSLFFTVLMLTVEEYHDIKGFGLVIAIVCLIFWIVTGLLAINLTSTNIYYDGSTIIEQTVTYADTWPITLFYILAGIFPFLIILKKIPETWEVDK